jgi:hypothetical protein
MSISLVLLCGCEQPFNRQNFDLIKVGVDTRDDVVNRIGRPQSTEGDSDEWYYEDQSVHNAALIHFARSGKVSGKQWLEGDDSRLTGGNPHVAPRDGTLGGEIKRVIGLD